GLVAIVSAGTSDMAVAEEARLTAEFMGAEVSCHYDVGVAGLHRLLADLDDIRKANAVVAVAGMEGALASVIGGLVSVPLIAVPTSVGYGASFGGVAALLAMLNSCAAGVSVVNIDNGFAGGYNAALINRLAVRKR
ncbi:MAG TPA: nickel pincer cofactor biosynthesis protein LarB, partial [Phycisphaerae bacterium]|nr:nickel pincer cofactor biosynthesis protein LarB [Phycisphaerae bacterium]